jgi:integrase
MSVYDKHAKRIKAIEAGIAAGKIDPVKGATRLAKYKAKPPDYWVKGFAYGKWYDLQVPEKGIKAAKAFDARIRLQVEDRTFSPAELIKVKLRVVFQAHLSAQAGKGGDKAARTRCGHACRLFGHITLDSLHADPKRILEAGFANTPPAWAPKTKWLLWSYMKAAIERYKREHPKLQINNPMTAFPMSHGTRKRKVSPTHQEHLQRLSHVRNNPLRWVPREGKGPTKVGFPAYFYPLLVIKYQQGLRGMEIIPWRFEKADLDARRPAVMTRILKKDGETADQWVVLTPTSYKALKDYLQTIPGPKEVGPIWPVKNWPTGLMRRLLDECDQHHLVPHDDRRAWTMNNIDKDKRRRQAAAGRETDDSEEFYIHFGRKEQEAFYEDEWAEFEAGK